MTQIASGTRGRDGCMALGKRLRPWLGYTDNARIVAVVGND
jgi:hypothetical protein